MLDIAEQQNSTPALQRLAAQRWLYRKAKTAQAGRLASAVAAVVLLLPVSFIESALYSQVATMAVVLLWFVDQALLVPWADRKKQEAAAIREDFDCIVLDLPWPEYASVDRPTDDRVKELAIAASWSEARGLAGWYSVADIPADPVAARLHCQRANCRWDARVRRDWVLFVKCVAGVVAAVGLVAASLAGVTLLALVLAVAAGLRLLAWLLTEVGAQSAARQRMETLHGLLSRLGEQASELKSRDVRRVQARIFEHRRLSPTVPEWFFERRKRAYEAADAA